MTTTAASPADISPASALETKIVTRRRRKPRNHRVWGFVSTLIAFVIIAIWIFISIFPLYWNAVAAFLPVDKIFSSPPPFFPYAPTLQNFPDLYAAIPTMWRNIINSLVVAVVSSGVNVFLATLAGYAFAKLRFWGKEVFFYGIVATMAIPALVGFVPLFLLMGRLGLGDNIIAVILPGLAGAFGVFLFRQVMEGLPDELFEAGKLDGASSFTMYRVIALPLVVPMILTQFIVQFLGAFNDYFWPLVILRSPENYTFSLALGSIQGQMFASPWGQIMAGALILQIPVLIIFAFLSKYIIPNSLAGAVKG